MYEISPLLALAVFALSFAWVGGIAAFYIYCMRKQYAFPPGTVITIPGKAP